MLICDSLINLDVLIFQGLMRKGIYDLTRTFNAHAACKCKKDKCKISSLGLGKVLEIISRNKKNASTPETSNARNFSRSIIFRFLSKIIMLAKYKSKRLKLNKHANMQISLKLSKKINEKKN